MVTDITALPELVMRSLDANWNYTRWSQLPDDGNRYEVIDGVLYRTTVPSYFHQWIIRQIVFALIDKPRPGAGGLSTVYRRAAGWRTALAHPALLCAHRRFFQGLAV